MIVVIPGKETLTPAEAASGMYAQGGPLNHWYLWQFSNPTPWLGVIPDNVAPAPATPTTQKPQPLIRLYAGLTDSTSRAAFLQRMGVVVSEGLGADVAEDGVVSYNIGGIRAVPNFGHFDYGSVAKSLGTTGIDFAVLEMQPYDHVSGGGPSALVHWSKESRLAVVARNRANGKTYDGSHNAALVFRSPEVFAVEVANALR